MSVSRGKSLSSAVLIGALLTGAAGFAELGDTLAPKLDHPAIQYFTGPVNDPVSELNRKLQSGQEHLKFEGPQGYLRSVLAALNVPIESQIAVFLKTSLQADLIELRNPRTIFFNDAVVVAWMHGGFIELASQDPRWGVVFHILPQQSVQQPAFQRRDDCLRCHQSDASLGVAGMMIRSTFTGSNGELRLIDGASLIDHRSPMEERWGGWYVTGSVGSNRHMGNAVVTDPDHPKSMVTASTLNLASLREKIDTQNYLSPYSDVAALMVFDHQMYMTNLITRVGWEIRAAKLAEKRDARDLTRLLRDTAKELVDYLLFIDETPLNGVIRGTSGFTEKFAAQGPRDSQGRSLRELDLQRRLMRYPCSYMIYSQAFDALPAEAKEAIYKRMWEVLSASEQGGKYARLTVTDRRAVVEILRETKPDLPKYFQPVSR
jgi:hypothetical protein